VAFLENLSFKKFKFHFTYFLKRSGSKRNYAVVKKKENIIISFLLELPYLSKFIPHPQENV
jgi:hypothetical protein